MWLGEGTVRKDLYQMLTRATADWQGFFSYFVIYVLFSMHTLLLESGLKVDIHHFFKGKPPERAGTSKDGRRAGIQALCRAVTSLPAGRSPSTSNFSINKYMFVCLF